MFRFFFSFCKIIWTFFSTDYTWHLRCNVIIVISKIGFSVYETGNDKKMHIKYIKLKRKRQQDDVDTI